MLLDFLYKAKLKKLSTSFYTGAIVLMSVARHSHVTKPYYVEVLYYKPNAKAGEIIMITNIPGEHSLEMVVGENWEYHKKRMKVIGHKNDHKDLLYNQKLYHK